VKNYDKFKHVLKFGSSDLADYVGTITFEERAGVKSFSGKVQSKDDFSGKEYVFENQNFDNRVAAAEDELSTSSLAPDSVSTGEDTDGPLVPVFSGATSNGSLSVGTYLDFISDKGVDLIGTGNFAVALVADPDRAVNRVVAATAPARPKFEGGSTSVLVTRKSAHVSQ
jgi:hypothetical protein